MPWSLQPIGSSSGVEAVIWCCSAIEAKTRAALGQTDINDMYDKDSEPVEEDVEEPEPLAVGAA